MRKELVHRSATSHHLLLKPPPFRLSRLQKPRSAKLQPTFFSPCRSLAQVQSSHDMLPGVWFDGTDPHRYPPGTGVRPEAPPDERTLKLGKTLRTLQARLPTLLASPLPTEILSPQISLHLFPSTHPHLPSVSGRVAYHAALWTAPVSWGRVPFFDVKLIILNERMIKNGTPLLHTCSTSSKKNNNDNEKLVVRWKTEGKTKGQGVGALYRGIGAREQVDKITEWLGGETKDDGEFTGLFIFEFDEEGRIATHTIEHAQEGGNWDRASRVVTITDWLLGKAKRRKEEVPEGLAWGCEGHEESRWGRRAEARRR